MEKKTIVNIVCLGHSGSTLLGNILGSHSKILHLGELVAPIKKKLPIICRECQDQKCPIWGDVITEHDLVKEFNNFSLLNFCKFKYFKSFLNFFFKRIIFSKIFNQFPDIQVIIDSSKNLDWYTYQSKNRNYNHLFIFLKRNTKAIIASNKRSHKKTISEQIPNLNNSISRLNQYYHDLASNVKYVVEYENITVDLQNELLKTIHFIGLNYEESMKDFNNQAHHLIGGNQANLIQKNKIKAKKLAKMLNYSDRLNDYEFYSFKGIKIDERWKEELSDNEKKTITENVIEFDF